LEERFEQLPEYIRPVAVNGYIQVAVDGRDERGEKMKLSYGVLVASWMVGISTSAIALPQSGPPSDGSPGWYLQGNYFNETLHRGSGSGIPMDNSLPVCSHSPVCDRKGGIKRPQLQRLEWQQTMGYTYTYPVKLPFPGGVPAVAIDSKGDLWVLQRNAPGQAQLSEFGPDRKLIRTVGDDVIGHQLKAHGMAIDAQDNVWIADANGATVQEVSPGGKLLKTIGVRGHRGDWDEAKHQRLLWQPLCIAVAPNGDIYIGEGHANESPNDTDLTDPTNNIGAARVIHLDKNGNFVNQWFGNEVGPGRFSMVHGIAVDPRTGDVWIGDREQYRLVVYTADGQFLRTIQMRNLTCAVAFDPHGNLWVASGEEGQILKVDRNGKVLGALGKGSGRGPGWFHETNYIAWDKQGNMYTGDTNTGPVTEFVAPKSRQ
jgi:hypothetical protein